MLKVYELNYLLFIIKICFNWCQSLFICQLVEYSILCQIFFFGSSLSSVAFSVLKHSSHIQRLYCSSTLSYIQWCIDRASYLSTNLPLVVHLSIKTYPVCLFSFQTFFYSLKRFETLFLCLLTSIFFVFLFFNFIVLFFVLFRKFKVVQIFQYISYFLVFSYSSSYVQPQALATGDSS